MQRQNISVLAAIVFGCLVAPCIADSAEAMRPNILVILCDDLGYGDLACYGNAELKTPNIDRLARERLRLTSCYAAAANCSPARAGLMTGRSLFGCPGRKSRLAQLAVAPLRVAADRVAELSTQLPSIT